MSKNLQDPAKKEEPVNTHWSGGEFSLNARGETILILFGPNNRFHRKRPDRVFSINNYSIKLTYLFKKKGP
jgi:hypothetical protein